MSTAASSHAQHQNATEHPLILSFAVRLDSLNGAGCEHLGGWTHAALTGPPGAPLLVVLGGISGSKSVALTPEGKAGWWHSLFGHGAPLGGDRYRILGIDFAADDTGTYAPDTGEQASIIADTLSGLGETPLAIIGASYGGMVALAYAERFQPSTRLVIISAASSPHPVATAARSLQRKVVDLGLRNGCATEALAIARGMAMITYRTRKDFGQRFAGGIASGNPLASSEPRAYLDARGAAYLDVMPPGRFLSLSASIDRHGIDPKKIVCPCLVIGVEEDQVVPIEDSARLAAQLGGPAHFRALRSVYGHDAFLKEPNAMASYILPFLEEEMPRTPAT